MAGRFYPGDAAVLRAEISGYLAEAAERVDGAAPCPKAIIAPHAGTIYSGPIAASAYVRLRSARAYVRRVVLLGPAHRVYLEGIAAPSVDAFRTPLGDIPIDRAAVAQALTLPQVVEDDEPHRLEHSLEVHLPFLQLGLEAFTLVPFVVGRVAAATTADLIDLLWGGRETLLVISSDLSHFHDYATARRIDRETSDLIEQMRFESLSGERACGVHPVSGLLLSARRRGMQVTAVDVRNSGDTAGSRREVVGYGSYLVD